jgi:hypothetical protein
VQNFHCKKFIDFSRPPRVKISGKNFSRIPEFFIVIVWWLLCQLGGYMSCLATMVYDIWYGYLIIWPLIGDLSRLASAKTGGNWVVYYHLWTGFTQAYHEVIGVQVGDPVVILSYDLLYQFDCLHQ